MSTPSSQRPFRHSIRFKLLLVALTLLVIPWAGYRYIQETENFLRNAQRDMLLGTAQAVAATLHNRGEMFHRSNDRPDISAYDSHIYVHPLDSDIQLDGYTEDWEPYLRNFWRQGNEEPGWFEYLVGERKEYLYLLFQVEDERIVYQQPGETRTDQSDYIDISLERPEGGLARYRITTTGPGWVNAQLLSNFLRDPYPVEKEMRIKGEWQETENGYVVELRLPRRLLGQRIALGVGDVDDPATRALAGRVTTAPMEELDSLGGMVRPNPQIEEIIHRLEHENARIWVLDRNRRVLARQGQLIPPADYNQSEEGPSVLLAPLFRLVLGQPSSLFRDERASVWQIKGPEVDAALGGNGETRLRSTPDAKAFVLSAAWPVHSNGQVVGAVLVEQSTNQILSLQNEAMERLIGITLVFFAGTGLVLLGFASFLTGRIRRLSNRVEKAVTPDGRILSKLKAGKSRDEIGDLDRSFSSVLNRLYEYNHYLEAMASRLAHELRTPLTVVKTSLENMEPEQDTEAKGRYLSRAREGVGRLETILHRMREATRLEQLLLEIEPERFNLSELLHMARENYATAFPDTAFDLELPAGPVQIHGAPELISQALDKLVNNALDFHTPGTPIRLALTSTEDGRVELSVSNQGPPLPQSMEKELFSSMISVREPKEKQEEPHLGLGLYLVRLICEFHGGRAGASNLEDGSGVRFNLSFPPEAVPDS